MLKYSDLLVNVIKVFPSAFFNEFFENVRVKTNGGNANIFSVVLDCAVKDEQMSLIPESKRPIPWRKGQGFFFFREVGWSLAVEISRERSKYGHCGRRVGELSNRRACRTPRHNTRHESSKLQIVRPFQSQRVAHELK